MNRIFSATVLLLAAAFVHGAVAQETPRASPPHHAPRPGHPYHHAPAHAPGSKDHKGFIYSLLDGPLAFTITAKNTTVEATNHTAGVDTAQDECEIQGANPSVNHNEDYKKGPLEVLVAVGQESVISLHPFKGASYKNANVSGSANVTSVTPSTSTPTTLTFSPNYHTEQSTVHVGVFSGTDATASCKLTVRFHAIPSKESLQSAVDIAENHHAPGKAPGPKASSQAERKG